MLTRDLTTTCPECGAAFQHAATTRKQRVQCPKCRSVVTLLPPEEKSALLEIETPLTARIEVLETRIRELEQTLTDFVRNARPRNPFRWAPPDLPASYSDMQAEILRENLSKIAPHEIAIQTVGKPPAAERARWLKSIFTESRWTVLDGSPGALSIPENSLALATSLPVSRAMSSAYLALHASGFPLRPQFTPQGEESLIVG